MLMWLQDLGVHAAVLQDSCISTNVVPKTSTEINSSVFPGAD